MEIEELAEALHDIISGGAVCFLGAGFSREATDLDSKPVPDVSMLCQEICEFPGLEDETDAPLSDLADFCESKPELKIRLSSLLVKRLTHCVATADQTKILSMPWRSIFTTNFDDVAESALGESAIPVTPRTDATQLRAERKNVYYLHGRARDIIDGSSEPNIVLSESNYINLKSRNRQLYSALENDIHASSRIVFIGYSVRDVEIATRLFSIPRLKQKSIVICAPGERPIALARLGKFGAVYPIGTAGFANELPDNVEEITKENPEDFLNYVDRISPISPKSEIENSDVEKLILTGVFDYSAYAYQILNEDSEPTYCIKRKEHIEAIFTNDRINRFVVTSDLGNGKSIFLGQVIYRAQELGFETYEIKTQLPEALLELETLLNSPTRRIYIVDGLVRYRKIAKFIGARIRGNSILVATSGSYIDEISFSSITEELSGATKEIDLNYLVSGEISDWDKYLERWGYWDERIEESLAERIEFLKDRCGAENRSIVLALFRGTSLSRKIDSIVEFFLKGNNEHARAFIAILINSLCQKHVEWSRIVQWIEIDEPTLKHKVLNSPVGEFMTGSKRWHEFTSTELADYILNSYEFNTSDIVDVYTTIVRQTAYSSTDLRAGYDSRENLKELMRFRFLTRLFQRQEDGIKSIDAVYKRLSKVPKIRMNDQFWLQYAMASMEVGDLGNAETYLGTAIGLANKKGMNYSKRQILDQQARLLFRKNTKNYKELDVLKASEILRELLLEKSEPAVHPLRSAVHIHDFLEENADLLSVSTTDELRSLLVIMKEKSSKGRLEKSLKGETDSIKKSVRNCLLILENL